jgi:hypothetical protein
MDEKRVPADLVRKIREGRCIAFVGAGFSAAAQPTWTQLLRRLAQKRAKRLTEVAEAVATRTDPLSGETAEPNLQAFELEAYGQLVKDAYVDDEDDQAAWEAAIGTALKEHVDSCARERRDLVEQRALWLQDLPFRAVLTTNFDEFLPRAKKTAGPTLYNEVLRGEHPWFSSEIWRSRGRALSPIVKLHGDANGDPETAPVVFARSDYRRLLYGTSHHTEFLCALFATHTVLFLGVSFTDAYLNELRSAVLSLIGRTRRTDEPWGYAVVGNKTAAWQQYMLMHEGIQCLAYSGDHSGFDDWFRRIHDETSQVGRLRSVLCGRRVVWIDPNPRNNADGVALLRAAGAEVRALLGADELQSGDREAALLITHFGWKGRSSTAQDVLARIAAWRGERPPVIVFASGVHAEENRHRAIRLGAWEYASTFEELAQLIDRLFLRRREPPAAPARRSASARPAKAPRARKGITKAP